MTDESLTSHVSARTSENLQEAASASLLQARMSEFQLQQKIPSDLELKAEMFESLEDLNDFMAHYQKADIVDGDSALVHPQAKTSETVRINSATPDVIARELARKAEARETAGQTPEGESKSVRPQAKTSKTVRTSSATPDVIARELERKAKARKNAVRTSGSASKPPIQGSRTKAPSKPRLSALVEPGIYHGPPQRIVGWKHIPREVDVTRAQFRRQRVGVGKCTGEKLKDVNRAFSNAYFLAETARQEVAAIRRSPDAQILWHASLNLPEGSLAYWFGADYDPRQTGRMLLKIETILNEWSLAFCGGFRGLLPVWIRCKSKNGAGDGPARHLVANMIELFPRYFDMSRDRQIVTMLHEMGHRSTNIITPRDERHDICAGGWNREENMCYRIPNQPDQTARGGIFHGGNPQALALAAENGNVSARKTALNNIDNYVCYMWNRYKDRKGRMMQVGSPNAKPSSNNSKPPAHRPSKASKKTPS